MVLTRSLRPARSPCGCSSAGIYVAAPHCPGRGSKDALRRVGELLGAGHTHVVGVDIKAFRTAVRRAVSAAPRLFGAIPQGRPMAADASALHPAKAEGGAAGAGGTTAAAPTAALPGKVSFACWRPKPRKPPASDPGATRRPESHVREIGPHGSEGGAAQANAPSLPLSLRGGDGARATPEL